jgi:hypothetical protein
MPDVEHLRSHAARLRAEAMNAYENGNIDLADGLITRAMQYREEADTLDRRRGLDVPSRDGTAPALGYAVDPSTLSSFDTPVRS